MVTTNTRPAECCEASVVGRQQNQAGAVVTMPIVCAGRAERSRGGGSGFLRGVATGTASRATRGAAPSSAFGQRGAHGAQRDAATGADVRPHETRGALTIPYSLGAPPRHRRLSGSRDAVSDRTGCATVFDIAGPVPVCMARESDRAPRRVERRAGAISRAPVAQSEELPTSKRRVAGSSPAGRAIPFREVTK